MAEDIGQLVREAEAELGPADPGIDPQPLAPRAKAAAILAVGVGLAAVGSLWADLQQLDAAQRLVDGERLALAELLRIDDRVTTTAIIYTLVTVLSAITFLLWYSRAYRNAIGLGMSNRRYGTRRAIAYWFIPIVTLFRPKQVMNDIWRGSDPDLPTGDVSGRPVSPLLHRWWAFGSCRLSSRTTPFGVPSRSGISRHPRRSPARQRRTWSPMSPISSRSCSSCSLSEPSRPGRGNAAPPRKDRARRACAGGRA